MSHAFLARSAQNKNKMGKLCLSVYTTARFMFESIEQIFTKFVDLLQILSPSLILMPVCKIQPPLYKKMNSKCIHFLNKQFI
jgi:hypothetical protein